MPLSTNDISSSGTKVSQLDSKLTSMLAAIDRLLNIGSLYPPEHTKCLEVQENFRTCLQDVAGDAATLQIDVRKAGLRIQGTVIDPETDGIGAIRVHDILWALSVARMEISSEASGSELYQLVMTLQKQRHAVESSTEFQQLGYDSMPDTVKITQREFGSRQGQTAGGVAPSDKIQNAMSVVLESMKDASLDPETQLACQNIVEKFFGNIVERMNPESNNAGGAAEATRSLDEVLELGTHAIRHAMQLMADGTEDTSKVSELFKSAEEALAYTEARDSVELLVDLMNESGHEDPETPEGSGDSEDQVKFARDKSRYVLNTEDLKNAFLTVAPVAISASELPAEDNSELLAMRFHMLLNTLKPEIFRKLLDGVESLLETPLTAEQWEIVRTSCRELIKPAHRITADRVLPIITNSIRKSEDIDVVTFWIDICDGVDNEELLVAWPHLVDELLAKSSQGSGGKEQLVKLVAQLSYKQMRQAIPRLEQLPTVMSNKFDKRVFANSDEDLNPLFAALLDCQSAKSFGKLIFWGIGKNERQCQQTECLKVLPAYKAKWRGLFQECLTSDDSPEALAELRSKTVEVLIGALSSLSKDSKRDNWVLEAIGFMGKSGSSTGRILLQMIVSQKKFLFFAVWPKECRKLAEAGLKRGVRHVK